MYTRPRYNVTYAVGTSEHDEKRFIRKDVRAELLAENITRIQSRPGHRIIAVELAS